MTVPGAPSLAFVAYVFVLLPALTI